VVQATDIQVAVPYSRGTLTAQAPVSGYSGTAYTRFGVQRTLYRDYPTWFDFGSTSNMLLLAQAILATVSNVVQEGSVTYFGLYSTALNNHVAGTPIALDLAGFTATTSFEGMAAPVREVTLEMPQSGAAGWITRLRFSTRRQQYSADRLYVHPMFLAGPAYGAFGVSGMAPTMGYAAVQEGGTIFQDVDITRDMFTHRELVAGGLAAGAEQGALDVMGQREEDLRPDAAMARIEGQENAAVLRAENAEQNGPPKAAGGRGFVDVGLGPPT